MPPPLRCTSLIPSTSCTNRLHRSAQSRSFSITSQREQRVTRARRALFRWLNTSGANFASPLADSTNYLSAYNVQGELRRVVEQREKEQNAQKTSRAEGKHSENSAPKDPNEKERTPPETTRDLRPFPLNPSFISQPVLSEDFREVIWERIMKDGQSVREVSADLKVEMSRVGAVVRLKVIEKEWQRIVSYFNLSFFLTKLL